jgi:hypothetical protein
LHAGTYITETIYGTTLAIDLDRNELIHARTVGPDRPLAFVHIPRTSGFAFILFDNPELRPLAPRHHQASGPIIIVRRRHMPGGTFAFCDPFHRTYLIAHSDITTDGAGMAAFYGYDVAEWQHFKLAAVALDALPPAILRQIAAIEEVAATPPTSAIYLLRRTPLPERAMVAALMAGALIPSDVEILADDLVEDRAHQQSLASLFPNDPWSHTALPDLSRFLQARRTSTLLGSPDHGRTRPIVIGPALDSLADDVSQGDFVSLGHRCNIIARRSVAPTKTICIVAAARDDGAYLLDWIAYHRAIGVQHIFLYTNDNIDGSDRLLRALADAGEITLIESTLSTSGVAPVMKAYGHALSMLPDILDYRWCAIIDSDEMIGIDRSLFESIQAYIEWQELRSVDAIALNWLVFGSSGRLRWHDAPLRRRFQERYLDPHIKTICRPRMFNHSTPHFPLTDLKTSVVCRDALGEPHPVATPHTPVPRDSPAWIAHYFYRSFEEFVWKFSRGRGDQPLSETLPQINVPAEFMAGYVRQSSELPLTHDERMMAFAAETDAQTERLRLLPGVADCLTEIIAHYQSRSASFMSMLRTIRDTGSREQAQFYDQMLTASLTD